MTLRIGVLGAGQAGARHITGFLELAAVRIAAVADADPQRARAAAARCGARPYPDWRDVIALQPRLDAVVVALPHHMHLEAGCMAAARGLHVLMEKPIAATAAEGRRVVEACDRAGVTLTVGYVHRFREEALWAKRWIRAGMIGAPVSGHAYIASPRGPHLGAWVNAPETAGGGALLYTGIHAVDRLLWLINAPVTKVCAATGKFAPASQVEEAVVALLEFGSQAAATLAVHCPVYPSGATGWRSEIYGTSGVVRVQARHSVEIASARLTRTVCTQRIASEAGEHYAFARQAAAFAQAIREGEPSPIPGQDGLASLDVCQRIYACS